MEIEYTLTPDDAIAFQRYHFKASLSSRQFFLRRLFWGILASILVFIIFSGWKSVWGVLAVLLFWLVYLLMIPLSIRWSINAFGKRMKKEGENKALWGKRRLTIDAQGLFEKSEVGETRLRWDGVERVVETADYIFIYVTTVSAHVIPKKSFQDKEQALEFYQTAKRYFDNAHQVVS
jgi:hypothetical protein